jgi:hypothetical protein
MLLTALALAFLPQEAAVAAPKPDVSIPLPRRALPADTAFVLHFDAQSFLASSWWKSIGDMPEVSRAIERSEPVSKMRTELGLDPFRDLLSITVLGRDDKGDGAAVLVRTTDAIDGALDLLREQASPETMTVGSMQLERWGPADNSVVASTFATPVGDRVTILAKKGVDVVRVVRAADGDEPRLAQAERPRIQATPRPGTFLYVEAALPVNRMLDGTPFAKAAEGVERITIQMGEERGEGAEGKLFFGATIRTRDGREARRVADVLNGARAFLANFGVLDRMPPAAMDLYDGIVAEVHGEDVELGFTMKASDLEYLVEELADEVGARLR